MSVPRLKYNARDRIMLYIRVYIGKRVGILYITILYRIEISAFRIIILWLKNITKYERVGNVFFVIIYVK